MKRYASILPLLVALVACSARTPVVEDQTPSPSPSASPSTSSGPPPPPKARFAAFSIESAIVVYDVKADTQRRVAEGRRLTQPRFISRTMLSFVQESTSDRSAALIRLDLKTLKAERVFDVPTGILAYDWSPDRETVALITIDDRDYPHLEYRSVVGQMATQTVGTLARAPGREFTADDQVAVRYAKGGRRVLFAYTPASSTEDLPPEQSPIQVRGDDGSLLFAADDTTAPTMAVWAPNGRRLYFRDRRGGQRWDVSGGAVPTPLPGSPDWYDPWVSPDGSRIAFDTGPQRPRVQAGVYDIATGSAGTVSARGRAYPVFASTKFLWVQEIEACSSGCLYPAQPTTTVYRLNIATGNERRLALTKLAGIDVWYV